VINLVNGSGTTASRAGVNTVLSSGAGALSALFFNHWTSNAREYDIGCSLNGVLAGLVSITGSCAFVEMWGAVSIGTLGGVFYVSSSKFTLNWLKIDDPLDATYVVN
jgi:Amt family ammonium transporter